MKNILLLFSFFTAVAAFAIPEVSDVTFDSKGGSKHVKIGYSLSDAPVIMTVDIQTNATGAVEETDPGWMSIGSQNFTNLVGWNGAIVTNAGPHELTWNAYVSWPGQRTTGARAVVTVWPTNSGYWADNKEFWDRIAAERAAERAAEEARRAAEEDARRLAKHPLYMVVDLENANTVDYYQSKDEFPGGFDSAVYKTTKMVFRKVRAAGTTFVSGNPNGEVGRVAGGNPEAQIYIKLTNDYYLAIYECTQKQFTLIFGSNPSKFSKGDESLWGQRPVENVFYTYFDDARKTTYYKYHLRDPGSWPNADDVVAAHTFDDPDSFIAKFRAHSGLGVFLDLPTHAQWEFACRAGTTSALYTGEELSSDDLTVQHPELDGIARYYYNADAANAADTDETGLVGTARVGSYGANAWGFYDMYGNVSELCLDYYAPHVVNTAETPYVDYQGPASSSWKGTGATAYNHHIRAGGSWDSNSANISCRSAARTAGKAKSISVGFRLCLTIPED